MILILENIVLKSSLKQFTPIGYHRKVESVLILQDTHTNLIFKKELHGQRSLDYLKSNRNVDIWTDYAEDYTEVFFDTDPDIEEILNDFRSLCKNS